MSAELICAAVSVVPALAAWLCYPRRPWPAAVAAVLGVAVSALALPGALAAAAGAWCLLGAAGVYYAAHRKAAQFDESRGELEGVKARRRELAASLAELRRRGAESEREHKETLALYGMIKSLADALSWEDVRPKLEAAVDGYLGVSSFALYTADPHAPGRFNALSVRRLEGSPGASWATLERCLQEQGLELSSVRLLEAPERAVLAPITDSGALLGLFYARLSSGVDAQALLGKARSFASEIAFALRRVQLFQEMENLSRIDGLTGVFRRGDFDERLRQETIRAKTFKTTFGLMLLDIDHFKQLNDRYGHPFGDQVLKRVGELLNASVYDTDFVARYGGEEFVVLLPRAEPAGASRKAEMIRAAVEAEKFARGFESIRVTISIGIAHFPRDAASPEELVAEADSAMYQAKSRGRNRVVDARARKQAG